MFISIIKTYIVTLFSVVVICLGFRSEVGASLIMSHEINNFLIGVALGCGKKIIPIQTYNNIAYFSLAGGLGLLFLATFLNSKKLQLSLTSLAIISFSLWIYVKFQVDYDQIRRLVFTYNVQAEGTLANIAEGQERYKSEHGKFLNDLNMLRAHVAGSHGLDECVQILELKAYYNYWTASAKQVSSPEIIYWDSRKGSSLKKG